MSQTISKNKALLFVEIAGDFLTSIAKFILGFLGGSAAMIAEGFHSLADTSNQIFLLIGIENSKKPADKTHPFGYGKERFFWSFVSALFIMIFSGGMAIWRGVKSIGSSEGISNFKISFLVLGIALLFQVFNLFLSSKYFRLKARKPKTIQGIIHQLKLIKEPTIINLWLGDIVAVGGNLLAGVALYLVLITGNAVYDAVASIIIGIALVGLGIFLAKDSRDLLIGEAVTPAMYEEIAKIIRSCSEVEGIAVLKTMHLTPNEILINADVEFKKGLKTWQIEKAIDEIENRIKSQIPAAKQIFIEVESENSG